ncbi:MAG: ABC transporter ATP-binding protein/permease [Bacteroidaceae bacterium]|nr:ABC transporter ATP-binding protein/permease [Bacteroidaceae bacterium]
MSSNIPRWFWHTSRGLRLQSCINAVLGIIHVGLDFAFIAATKLAIDIATGRSQSSLNIAAALLIGIMLSQILMGFTRKWVAAILGVRSQNMLQLRLFSHLMQSEWSGIEKHHSGDVLNRLEHDVKDIINVITETIPSVLGLTVRFVGAFFFLYSMDKTLACMLVFVAPVFILLSKLYIRKMRALTREIRNTDSKIQSILQESIQHRIILKTLERCQTMVERLGISQAMLRKQIKQRTLFSSFSATMLSAGFGGGYLITFLWGANRLHDGEITYGMMIAFIQLVGQIQGPFRELTRYIPIIVNSITACDRLMELQETPAETTGETIRLSEGGIRINDVSYAYDEHRTVLSHLSYHFPIGSITAIQGETGAGKTTLIRLILALMKPQSGSLEIYNAQERSYVISPQTRSNLVYVPQGNTIFSGTLRDNLLLGNPTATEEQMLEALKTACAEFALERGLDATFGELGAGLSEGQAQRISIARALLRNGCILLLDEATSALDNETEQELLHRLHQWSDGKKTIIFITHRQAVLDYCTQSLTLKREN